ncbi:MAG: PCRF domain-containing protein, partial [Aquificaceae bacterium]|nr:PCRF domain-containing protein [Aquificaceae bacterium]
MLADIKEKLELLKEKFEDVKVTFNPQALKEELEKIDRSMSSADFWNDQEKAKSITQRRRWLEENLSNIQTIEKTLRDVEELAQVTQEEDLETLQMLLEEIQGIEKPIKELEIKAFLSEEMDSKNAYLTIQAGAGGVEACDWASMLLRMYKRWAERHGYEVEVVDINPDDVAGIK